MTTIEDIFDVFSLIDDWEERYKLLIDLGKELPDFPEELRRDEFLVRGCTSKVWMIPRVEGEFFYFMADSDAHIVKGLVALLYLLFNGKKRGDVLSLDVVSIFERLELDQNLSPNRRNGFFSMVEKIRMAARGN